MIYTRLPQGCGNAFGNTASLKLTQYGFAQSGRQWPSIFGDTLAEYGLEQSKAVSRVFRITLEDTL